MASTALASRCAAAVQWATYPFAAARSQEMLQNAGEFKTRAGKSKKSGRSLGYQHRSLRNQSQKTTACPKGRRRLRACEPAKMLQNAREFKTRARKPKNPTRPVQSVAASTKRSRQGGASAHQIRLLPLQSNAMALRRRVASAALASRRAVAVQWAIIVYIIDSCAFYECAVGCQTAR